MTNRFATLAAAAALSALFAGNAMAQASGEGPLFLNETNFSSGVSRDVVAKEAATSAPITNAAVAQAASADKQAVAATKSRAEVRAETRDALEHGVKVKSGEQS